jgi:hypothetical protein
MYLSLLNHLKRHPSATFSKTAQGANPSLSAQMQTPILLAVTTARRSNCRLTFDIHYLLIYVLLIDCGVL